MQDFEQLMNLYHGIFVWCGAAAILFLILAAVLFILLKIPQASGELTGRVARKAIAEMVDLSSETGGLTSRKIGEDGRRHRSGRNRTGALGTSKLLRRTGSISGSMAGGFAAAEPVSDKAVQTGPQRFVRAGGAPDDTGACETTVLSGNIQALKTPSAGSGGGASFVILRSIVEVHTDEVVM